MQRVWSGSDKNAEGALKSVLAVVNRRNRIHWRNQHAREPRRNRLFCEDCGKAFRKGSMAGHRKARTGEKTSPLNSTWTTCKIYAILYPCVCGECGRALDYLDTYQRIHTSGKPFPQSIQRSSFNCVRWEVTAALFHLPNIHKSGVGLYRTHSSGRDSPPHLAETEEKDSLQQRSFGSSPVGQEWPTLDVLLMSQSLRGMESFFSFFFARKFFLARLDSIDADTFEKVTLWNYGELWNEIKWNFIGFQCVLRKSSVWFSEVHAGRFVLNNPITRRWRTARNSS